MDKAKNKKRNLILLSILGLVLFFGTWELLVHVGVISERNLCAPSTAVQTFLYKLTNTKPDGATLFAHFFSSIKLSLAGFVLAVVIGIPLGLFMGYYKGMDSFFTPLFEVVRPIPPIAWIPIVILTLGIGFKAKVFIIFISAFVPCVVNSYLGIKLTDPTLIDVAQTFGASRWQIFRTICIPSSMNHGLHRRARLAGGLLVHAGGRGDAGVHQGAGLHDPDRPQPDPSGHHHRRHADDRPGGRADGLGAEPV